MTDHAYGGREHDLTVPDEKCLLCKLAAAERSQSDLEALCATQKEALEDLLENLGGHDHWRAGGTGGRCETCVRQSMAASRARDALRLGEPEPERSNT